MTVCESGAYHIRVVSMQGEWKCAACYCKMGEEHHTFCPWAGILGTNDKPREAVMTYTNAEGDYCCPPGPVIEPIEDLTDPIYDAPEEDIPPCHVTEEIDWGQIPTVPFEQKLRMAGDEISTLVVEKNRAYGNSVNKTVDQLRSLFPCGIHPDKYVDLLLMVRVLDKFNRLADGDAAAFGENPWRDIAGYGIIGMAQKVK